MLESRRRRIKNFVFAFGAITIVLVYRLFCICNTMIHETEKRLGMISWIVALSVTNVSNVGFCKHCFDSLMLQA